MAGRPSEYDPSYCDRLIEWGAEGKSVTWMAAELGISKQTLHNWAAANPGFMDALTRAKAQAQKWWEDAGQAALSQPGFNSSVWAKSMAARFPDDWRDNSKIEHVGSNGGAIQNEMVIRFEDGSDKPPV